MATVYLAGDVKHSRRVALKVLKEELGAVIGVDRTTATASVQDQVKRGRKAVRLLDAVLLPRLRKDPQLRRELTPR